MELLRRGVVLALVFWILGFTAATAQLTQQGRDLYDQWLSTAQRAEEVIAASRASSASLESLRAQLSDYREAFNTERRRNGDRIRTLQGQLEALGPPPGEGESDPPDIARLRDNLNEQLDALRVPRVISEEAHSRADGLIAEIDRIIRDRQTRLMTSRGPSPLNPAHWSGALDEVRSALLAIRNETMANLRSATVREELRDQSPVLVILVLIGSVLIARGRRWSERIGDYLRSLGGRGTGVWTFVISLTRILLPWIGVLAIVVAIAVSGIAGVRGTLILSHVPYWAAIILVFDWIWRQLYLMRVTDDGAGHPIARVTKMRVYFGFLALALVLFEMVLLFEKIENISASTRAVVAFPVVVLAGLLLLRLMQRRSPEAEPDADIPPHLGFDRLTELLRRILRILATVALPLAAIGYVFAAEAIVYPAVKSLALISALVILHRFLGSLYGLLTGKGEAARDSLFAVILAFVLAIVALPLLALYWGLREADLTEMWARLLEGFDIGGVQISPSNFLVFAVVFAIGYTLTRLLQSGLRSSLLPKTRIDPGGQNAIVAGTGYVGVFLAAILAITMAGFDLSSLAIVAGALSVGIGFGLQTIVSNFVSGIILLVERPISKGDWIDVNGQMGYVRDISVRSTRIETFDRTDVIIPNSDLISGSVTNYTRGNTVGRVIVPVGVAYGTDTRRVETILSEIANAHPMVLANPAPSIVFQGFGADSLDFEIRAILRDVNWVLSVKSDMNHEIARRFVEEGIEIPFAQRDVWLRNPEALAPTGGPSTPNPHAPVATEPKTLLSRSDMEDGDGNGEGDEI